jgi:hypothetical protein
MDCVDLTQTSMPDRRINTAPVRPWRSLNQAFLLKIYWGEYFLHPYFMPTISMKSQILPFFVNSEITIILVVHSKTTLHNRHGGHVSDFA